MANEYVASKVSVRDVWAALVACREDLGVPVRVVLYEVGEKAKPGVVCIVAQPYTSTGVETSPALVSRQAWPNNQFASLTAAIHWAVWDVYQRVDRALEASLDRRAE